MADSESRYFLSPVAFAAQISDSPLSFTFFHIIKCAVSHWGSLTEGSSLKSWEAPVSTCMTRTSVVCELPSIEYLETVYST